MLCQVACKKRQSNYCTGLLGARRGDAAGAGERPRTTGDSTRHGSFRRGGEGEGEGGTRGADAGRGRRGPHHPGKVSVPRDQGIIYFSM